MLPEITIPEPELTLVKSDRQPDRATFGAFRCISSDGLLAMDPFSIAAGAVGLAQTGIKVRSRLAILCG